MRGIGKLSVARGQMRGIRRVLNGLAESVLLISSWYRLKLAAPCFHQYYSPSKLTTVMTSPRFCKADRTLTVSLLQPILSYTRSISWAVCFPSMVTQRHTRPSFTSSSIGSLASIPHHGITQYRSGKMLDLVLGTFLLVFRTVTVRQMYIYE